MGGGDLNTKKSWHPNTMKNQERVWKAEQAAAEEQKRIQQLLVERNQERDWSELNDLARKRNEMESSDDARLGWMYEKPDKQIKQEDYLLGKAIDKNFDKGENADKNVIPAVANRVVGSSLLSSASDIQVDITRKMKEDPLLMVKERERAARAALLNNPLQRKKIAELLRKEQEQKLAKKSSNKSSNYKDDDLDRKLAEKLGALSGKKSINLASLLSSDDDSSDDSNRKAKKKKKKKSKSKQKNESDSDKPSTKKANKKRSDSSHSSDEEKSSPPKQKKKHDYQQDYQKHYDGNYIDDSMQRNKTSLKDYRNRTYNYERDHHETNRNTSERKRKYDSGDVKNRNDDDERCKRKLSDSRYSETKNEYRNKKDSRYSERRKDDSSRYDSRQEKTKNKHRKYVESSRDKYGTAKRNEDEGTPPPRDRSINNSHTSHKERDRHTEPNRKERDRSEEKKPNDYNKGKRKSGLSDEEKAARLLAMSAAGAEREQERARRVKESLVNSDTGSGAKGTLPPPRATLPDSLEARIHSNRHKIQRNERHMDQNFARR